MNPHTLFKQMMSQCESLRLKNRFFWQQHKFHFNFMKLFNHHYLPLVSRMPSPLSSSQCLQPLGTYQTNPFAICSVTAVPTYKQDTAGSSPQIHCVSKSRPIGFLNTSRCNHWLIIKWLTTKYNNIPNFLNLEYLVFWH